MKSIVKIIFLGVALAWMNGATAGTEPVPAAASPKAPVAAKPEKVDRARVEKRLSDRAAVTKKRTAVAESTVPGRKAQKTPAGAAPK